MALIALLAAIALAACTDRGMPSADAKVAGAPTAGGSLVIAAPTDLGAINPLVATEAYTQEMALHALFVPLVTLDSSLAYVPALARSWDISGDTAIVFHLRGDVRWHDGVPVRATDVAFTFERLKDPETGFGNVEFFEHYRTVEVVDTLTVRFTMDGDPDPLFGWSQVPPVPRHLLERIPAAELARADYNRAPVGDGPFRFASYQANDRWVFEANPDYPADLGGRPYLDRVVWRVIPENSAQVVELQTGNADLILSPRADQIAGLGKDPSLHVIVRPSFRYYFVGWNGKRPYLSDARVRRALSMAIDRGSLLTALRGGYGELAIGPIGSFHWAYAKDIPPLPFSPDSARALLAEAGYTDRNGDGVVEDASGKPLAIELKLPANNAFNRDLAEIIQSNLAAVGVRATQRTVDFSTLISDITAPERRFDGVLMGWDADYQLKLRSLFHSSAMDGPYQLASYSNPEVDRILDTAPLEKDREVARGEWHRFQEIMRRDQPWTFLWYSPDLFVVRDRVRDIHMDIRGPFATLNRWWISSGPAVAQ